MIKILNVISDMNIGGAGRCVLNFLKYYDRKKYAVKVVVPKGSLLIPEIEKLKTKVIEVNGIADKSFDFKDIGKLKKIIKKENPDIVHTHGTLSGRIAAKMCGKKIVYTRHSVFPVSRHISKGVGKASNKFLNEFFADDIIAVAQAAKDNLVESGISPKRIKVILNGVEKIERMNKEDIKKIKEKYGIDENNFVMGILARIEDVKGHMYIIEAAKILKQEGRNIKIIVAGTGTAEEKIKAKVKELELEDIFIFTGFLKDVKEILNILDLQLNASYGTEATSLSLLEGMSIGVPAVVSSYGGNPGVITQGDNGYIFKLKDSTDLAKCIKKIMDNPQTYSYMKEKSIEIYKSRFTAEIYTSNIEKIYDELMK